MSKVLTVGTFDTPHSGHVELFKRCRKLADLENFNQYYLHRMEGADRSLNNQVIVGLNSDDFVYKYKGKFPAYPYKERLAIIQSSKFVDKVIINDEPTLVKMLNLERPDFLVIGSDWAKKDYYKQIGVSEQWLQNNNIMLIYVPYTEGVSSTYLKERISES